MSKPEVWHGLTFEQWLKMWDLRHWRHEVGLALREIAASPDASVRDRLTALQTINEGIQSEALPTDPGYPEFMRDALLDIVTRGERRRWFGRRARKSLNAKLAGARWMLHTGCQFITGVEREKVRADQQPELAEAGPMLS